jgi:hypothetical protein
LALVVSESTATATTDVLQLRTSCDQSLRFSKTSRKGGLFLSK